MVKNLYVSLSAQKMGLTSVMLPQFILPSSHYLNSNVMLWLKGEYSDMNTGQDLIPKMQK